MNSEELPIPAVGAQLVQASEDWKRSAGEILTELFPYVFEASKRMSTRAICRWLEELHGIKISQPTISRALRNPEKYWEPFAELMEPHARIVERAIKIPMGDFMEDERILDVGLRETLEVEGHNQEEVEDSFREIEWAANYLRKHWFCLSPQTRSNMTHFFEEKDTEPQDKLEETK